MLKRKLLSAAIIGALLPLLPMVAQAADPDSATVYEVQQGVYSQFTFVTIDSVVVTGVGTSFFYIAEQGGGPYNGIYVTTGSTPAEPSLHRRVQPTRRLSARRVGPEPDDESSPLRSSPWPSLSPQPPPRSTGSHWS